MALIGKIIISGKIETLTGLHIGGSKSSLDIGGVDLNIIKTTDGKPYIPGSSLKGKLRSLLGRHADSDDVAKDPEYMQDLFGNAKVVKATTLTRLLVRDAPLDKKHFDENLVFKGREMEFDFSDVKWENRIDRKSGTAKDPRQLERVPAGARFDYELVYDIYSDSNEIKYGDGKTVLAKHLGALKLAMQLLQDDYLGGQGSRGYGQVVFVASDLVVKKIDGNGVYAVEASPADPAIIEFQNTLTSLSADASRNSMLQAG